MDIQRIMDWNTACGNRSWDHEVEKRLLAEEFSETIAASKKLDSEIKKHTKHEYCIGGYHSIKDSLSEYIDGAMDIIFVVVGSLGKLGFSVEEINRFMNEVCNSNFTKLPAQKKDGKVTKPDGFIAPCFDIYSHKIEGLIREKRSQKKV